MPIALFRSNGGETMTGSEWGDEAFRDAGDATFGGQ